MRSCLVTTMIYSDSSFIVGFFNASCVRVLKGGAVHFGKLYGVLVKSSLCSIWLVLCWKRPIHTHVRTYVRRYVCMSVHIYILYVHKFIFHPFLPIHYESGLVESAPCMHTYVHVHVLPWCCIHLFLVSPLVLCSFVFSLSPTLLPSSSLLYTQSPSSLLSPPFLFLLSPTLPLLSPLP